MIETSARHACRPNGGPLLRPLPILLDVPGERAIFRTRYGCGTLGRRYNECHGVRMRDLARPTR